MFSSGCQQEELPPGFLNVVGPDSEEYEIYRIAGTNPMVGQPSKLHFVAEQAGVFNQQLPLSPGQYLVLADCSSKTVLIYPGQTETLSAHRISFTPPHKPASRDKFTIQCDRSGLTQSRQTIRGRFQLNVLAGQREILVGMIPLKLDVGSSEAVLPPFELSALQIADVGPLDSEQLFFVSPVDERISATQSQHFGHWIFVMPGTYLVEVNGTKLELELKPGESRIIEPAVLTIASSDSIDLDNAAQILGKPPYVEINDGHYLEFNESYAVLPSPARIRISNSARVLEQNLVAGERVDLQVKSATVNLDCSPWDWTCLGEKEVMLYFENQPYPFAESVSDIPVLYSDSEETILIGIEGSRDIRYQLPKEKRDHVLAVGYAKLVPKPTFKAGQVTDLVRVESIKLPFSGHSLDIDLDEATVMPLFEGSYRLAQYVSLTNTEGERRRSLRNFTVRRGASITLEFPVYLSEKAFKALQKKLAKGREQKSPKTAHSDPQKGYLKML